MAKRSNGQYSNWTVVVNMTDGQCNTVWSDYCSRWGVMHGHTYLRD